VLELRKKKIDIVKIGGSIITDKETYRSLKLESVQKLSEVFSKWNKEFIIVHGAGSYGHVVADKFSIVEGYKEDSQLQGLVQIRTDMLELSTVIVSELVNKGLKALYFQTSALAHLDSNDTEVTLFLNPIKKALELGLTPILSGDVLFKNEDFFTIISGDLLIDLLVKNLDVERVFFLTDVDGLYTEDPNTGESNHLSFVSFDDIDKQHIAELTKEKTIDVTGSMKGKLEVILSIINYVDEVIIVNGNIPNRIRKIIQGKETICTRIEGKKSTQR